MDISEMKRSGVESYPYPVNINLNPGRLFVQQDKTNSNMTKRVCILN